MSARYLVHPDSILEWVTGVQIYPLHPKPSPKPARKEPQPDGKAEESKKEEPDLTADSKPEKGTNKSKESKQAKGKADKENERKPEGKSEVVAEPRSKAPRALSFTLDFSQTEYDSSTSDSEGGRARMTHITVKKTTNEKANKKADFVPGEPPKLRSCLKRTKPPAVEDEKQEDGRRHRRVDTITEENTRRNRGIISVGHISKAKVNCGDYLSLSNSPDNHPHRLPQAWLPLNNISASPTPPHILYQNQSNCNYNQRQDLNHQLSQTQDLHNSCQRPRPNRHHREQPPDIQQQSQCNNAPNPSNCSRPRTQSVQQPLFQQSSIMQAPQSQIIQPIRAEVIMREDVIESPMDPRPNAFFCAKTGVLRVYHGAQYGNPYATILPHPPMPIGTYPPHAGQFMRHPAVVQGTVPALVPGGPPSMHAPLPSPAPQYHNPQQANTPAINNRNFSGGNNFQYGGPQGVSLGPPPIQSPNNHGWQTLTAEQADNMPTGNIPGSFPMDAPANDQQSSFHNNSGSGWKGSSNQQRPGNNPTSPASGPVWQNANQEQQQKNFSSSNTGGNTPAWQNNGGNQQQNNVGNVPGWQNNIGGNQNNSAQNTPAQNSSAPNNQSSNDNSGNWNGGNQNSNNSLNNNNSGGSGWNDSSNNANSGGGSFNDSSNNDINNMNSGGDWNNSNSNQQRSNDTYNNQSGGDSSWGINDSSNNNNNSRGRDWNNNESLNGNNDNSTGQSWNNHSSNKYSGRNSFANNDSTNHNSGGGDWNKNSSNNNNNLESGWNSNNSNQQQNSNDNSGGGWNNNNTSNNINDNSGGNGWDANVSNQQQDSNDNSGGGWNNNNTFNNTNNSLGGSGWNANSNRQSPNNQFNTASNNSRGSGFNNNNTQAPNNQSSVFNNNDNNNNNIQPSNNDSAGNDWAAPANPAPWGDMSAAQSGGPPSSPQNNNNFNNNSGGSGWNNNTPGPNFQNNNHGSGGGGGGVNKWGNEPMPSAGSWGGDNHGSSAGAVGKQSGW